jgi:hypothetical protein
MNLAAVSDEADAGRYIAWLDIGSPAPLTRRRVENLSRSEAKLKLLGGPIPNEFTLHFDRRGRQGALPGDGGGRLQI